MSNEKENLTQTTDAETSTQDQTNNELDLQYFETCTLKQFQSGEVFEKLRQILKQDYTGVAALTTLPMVAKAIKENSNIPIAATQFMSGFKAYKKQADARDKENSKSTSQSSVRMTEFPNLDERLQLECKNYKCDENGITDLKEGKLIYENILLPTATLIGIDENGIEKIEISFKDHKGRWRSQVLPCSMAYSRAGVITLADAGAAVTSKNAEAIGEYLCHMVHTNGEKLPEKKCISRAGWYIDPEDDSRCFYPYATNGKEVVNGAFGNSKSTLSAIHTKGNKEAWLEMVKPLRTQKALRAYLCASFASPLLPLVGGLPFFVHLYGQSAAGKSVSLKLSASIWGNPVIGGGSNDKYIRSLSSTENSLEFLASTLHNIPCCLDELQSRNNKETDSLVYRLTQGTGRERLTKSGSLNNANLSWKNIILTNGEHALNGASAEDSGTNSGAGAIGRTLNLLVDQNLIPNPTQKCPKICEVCDRNYGHAGRDFILGIIDQTAEILDRYKKIKMRISPKTDGPVSKQFDSVALLILADELSSEIIFGDEASKDMEDYLLEMIRPTATVNAHALALDWLQGFVVQNSARFTRHKDNEKTWHHNSAISYIGSITDTEISINKRIFADEYNRQFKNSSCALFLKWAEENKILYAAAQRKERMRKYIPNDEEYPSYVFWRERIFPEKGSGYTGTSEYLHEYAEKEKKDEAEVEPEIKMDDDPAFVWENESYEQEKNGSDF